MLELHKIKRVSHVFACPIVFFFCFMSEFGRKECSQLSKNDHFFVQLAAQVLFPKFLSKEGVVYVRIAWNDKSATWSCVASGF